MNATKAPALSLSKGTSCYTAIARTSPRIFSNWTLAVAPTLLVVGLVQATFCASQTLAANGDNFDDNSKNTTKWGTDRAFGRALLTERQQRLEYTCGVPTQKDEVLRPWLLTRFPYNADWELQMDTFNATSPTHPFQVNSMSLEVLSPSSDLFYVEFYSSALNGLPSRTGFSAELETGDTSIGTADQAGGFGVTNGAVRVAFNSTTKVVTLFYDTEVSDGYQWLELGSFGLAGSGGTNGTTDWGLKDSDQFTVYLSGFSDFMTVFEGQMYVDNFQETGGVISSGGPIPEPLGSFEFRFPTNNLLLTRMVSVSGNYQGVSPTAFHRNYSIDVAQDESGKLSAMGTMDGILDKNGGAQISGVNGTVKTVNGEPTAQIKGSFKGTRDGETTTLSGKATTPVQVIDVGGGTNGIGGSGSYSSKVGGVPFSGKNVPVQLAAPPGAVEQLKQEWTLRLDISRKLIGTKERTVASAELVLPNGDTLEFPQRVVKYSATKGYNISFTRGTNVTVNPATIDKKSSINLKRLTFTQESNEPSGGTITYRFLGQKGTAELQDFLEP